MKRFQPRICETSVETSSLMHDEEAYEKPYVTQFDKEKPAMFMIISMTISLPRQLALDVSPCQTGAGIISMGHLDSMLCRTSRSIDAVSYTSNNSVSVSH